MSYSISYNAPTTTTQVSLDIPVATVESEDFAVKQNIPEIFVMTNTGSPMAFPEDIRVDTKVIQNVYQGTGVETSLMAPTKRGRTVHVQLNQKWLASDSSDAAAPQYVLPVQASITLKLPDNPLISDTDIRYLLRRCIAVVYTDAATTSGDHWAQWFRGALSLK